MLRDQSTPTPAVRVVGDHCGRDTVYIPLNPTARNLALLREGVRARGSIFVDDDEPAGDAS